MKIMIIVAVSLAAAGVVLFLLLRAKKKETQDLKSSMKSIEADVARKNAALVQIADNAEKLKNEKKRIAKSDLDGLIDIARELPNLVSENVSVSGVSSGDSSEREAILSGRIVR